MSILSLDIDFYSDAVIRDPYPVYEKMRAVGPVVYLPQNDRTRAVTAEPLLPGALTEIEPLLAASANGLVETR